MQKNTPHLSDRDLKTIYDIARFKFRSSEDLWHAFYASTTYENATNRLTSLHKHGFLSREFAYPRAVKNPGQRPTAIYFFTEKNRALLREYLHRYGKADLYDDFAVLSPVEKDESRGYSNAHLVHELKNAEFFRALERAPTLSTGWDVLMWEMTSPLSSEIPDKDIRLRVKDRRTRTADGSTRDFIAERHFNPDGLAFVRAPDREITFLVVETDNNSNNPQDMRAKFEAFIGYGPRFPHLIASFARKHHLDIPHPEDILVRYLFPTANPDGDHKRRNQLFLWSLPYDRQKQFLFASLTDCAPAHLLTGTIWMRGREYHTHARAHMERIIHPDTAPTVKLRRQREMLNDPQYMPLVSLAAE